MLGAYPCFYYIYQGGFAVFGMFFYIFASIRHLWVATPIYPYFEVCRKQKRYGMIYHRKRNETYDSFPSFFIYHTKGGTQ